MAEQNAEKTARVRRMRHRGHGTQVLVYLGKQLRFFINESDWKVLVMAGIIAALVGMVINKRIFVNMEGSMIGAFSLTCVAIWNGCFNSIQSVCRERPIIKREHRSGMHITSYMLAHMIYQFFLCAMQTGLTIYVLQLMGVQFPQEGFITPWPYLTPWSFVDIGISMLLISYASDMLSLLLSSMSHTTTTAMTAMPFVLIFQLVFSGGIIPLPAWSQAISNYTISNYGIKVLASQAGYNELPMVTAWNTLDGMRKSEIGGSVTVGQLMDLLNSPAVGKYRDTVVVDTVTVAQAADVLNRAADSLHLKEKEIVRPIAIRAIVDQILTNDALQDFRNTKLWGDPPITIGSLLSDLVAAEGMDEVLNMEVGTTVTLEQALNLLHAEEFVSIAGDQALNEPITLGRVIDLLNESEKILANRDKVLTVKTTVGEILELFGEQKVKEIVEQKTAQAARKPDYAMTRENIFYNWRMLGVFIAVFALAATLVLEMIDHDKR